MHFSSKHSGHFPLVSLDLGKRAKGRPFIHTSAVALRRARPGRGWEKWTALLELSSSPQLPQNARMGCGPYKASAGVISNHSRCTVFQSLVYILN